MKTVKSVLPKMAGFFLVMLIITSVIYPAVITAAANVAFGHEANGSVIVGKDGTKYGSALLAQEFTGNQYLWGRVMNVDTGTFDRRKRRASGICRCLQQDTGRQ